MKDVKLVRNLKVWIYSFVLLVDILVAVALSIIMPITQGYPPYSEEISFQKQVEQFTHVQQYAIILFGVAVLHIISLKHVLANIYKYLNKKYRKNEITEEEIKTVRKDCINIPYKFYIIQISVIILLGMITNIVVLSEWMTVFRFILIIFAMTTLIAIVQFIFLQQTLGKVLLGTYEISKNYQKNTGYRIKFYSNLVLQIIPFLAVSVIIISLIGYAKATEEKGNASAAYYKAYLQNRTITDVSKDGLNKVLQSVPLQTKEDYYFIIPPNRDEIYVSNPNEKVTDFFLKYMDTYYDITDGRAYEFYGTEKQAYTQRVIDKNGQAWYIGFEYYTRDYNLMYYFIIVMIVILVIYVMLLRLLSKNISNNITNVSLSLKNILNEENSTSEILPIVSNNEVGDVSYYYNRIQEKVLSQQEIIQKQGQLATLGELAGGMAHDINTPISAINTAIIILQEQIKDEDQREVLSNMKLCTEKIIAIVNSMRNQIRNLGSEQKEWFEVEEIIEDCKVIAHNELKHHGCNVNTQIEKGIQINGEKNKLGQVITNIIMNSIGAYEEKKIKGDIDIVVKQVDNKCVIEIRDYAGGIPENIQPYIFKNILTTKGTKGTGIGLYLAYSVIKGNFNGHIHFESKVGDGTAFIIEIPNKEENKI